MQVTALCIRLLLKVFLLLVARVQHSNAQKGDAAFLHIVPTRLQFFEYQSVSFTCMGLSGSAKWRGVRNIEEFIPTCSNSTVTSSVTCNIYNAFETDSGEYWCEAGGGERSSTVNITVTAGSVILESPVLPVMEGDAVTLHCRNKTSSTDLPAVFYKDDLFMGSSSTGNLTIHYVYKSHEGLYKCNISGAGESPGSWLAVRALHREACVCSDRLVYVFLLLRTVFTIVMVALLLVVVGLLHCGKLRVTQK